MCFHSGKTFHMVSQTAVPTNKTPVAYLLFPLLGIIFHPVTRKSPLHNLSCKGRINPRYHLLYESASGTIPCLFREMPAAPHLKSPLTLTRRRRLLVPSPPRFQSYLPLPLPETVSQPMNSPLCQGSKRTPLLPNHFPIAVFLCTIANFGLFVNDF